MKIDYVAWSAMFIALAGLFWNVNTGFNRVHERILPTATAPVVDSTPICNRPDPGLKTGDGTGKDEQLAA